MTWCACTYKYVSECVCVYVCVFWRIIASGMQAFWISLKKLQYNAKTSYLLIIIKQHPLCSHQSWMCCVSGGAPEFLRVMVGILTCATLRLWMKKKKTSRANNICISQIRQHQTHTHSPAHAHINDVIVNYCEYFEIHICVSLSMCVCESVCVCEWKTLFYVIVK